MPDRDAAIAQPGGWPILTQAEHRAMDLTATLWNVLASEIIGKGHTARQDLAELAADIHRIQHRIMAQAAARAYPDRYRLLGGELEAGSG